MQANSDPISALLLIGPGCPHCASLMDVLAKMVKQGDVAKLEIANVAVLPETARNLGVRSVPWLRLGHIEFEGAHSEGEIKQWLQRMQSTEGMSVYFKQLLSQGKLDKVIEMVAANADYLHALVLLASDPETDMKVQLGVAAVIEDLQGNDVLSEIVDDLGKMATSANAKIRADAVHFLSLTPTSNALPYLQTLATDDNEEVREIAAEALAEISVK